MFVGDFIMLIWAHRSSRRATYKGLLDAIDIVVQRIPGICFMARALTRNFASAAMLAQLKTDLVGCATRSWRDAPGDERGAIHQANLIPPACSATSPMCISHTSSCANTSLIDFTIERWLLAAGFTRPRTSHPRRPSGTPYRLPRRVGKSACQDGGTPDRGRQI